MDIVWVHQGGDLIFLPLGTKDQPLYLGKIFALPPFLGTERNVFVCFCDLLWRSPAGGAVLSISHSFALDVVQAGPVCQISEAAQDT